ncbi:cellulose biosynthesis protein BcsE [Pluralibacter gergoviae]|uniref:Cellulose biosynthesis protein BcsE n=1 Tax=Pluralibacter gergoviae TaxID=61647 RepID=A0A0J5L3C7_PLUGE|nr:cellulose biosynthesis protein BcsE [Pluralibacter gergoviae]KMK12839.1 cellulose biosynthesis protein BcsE [Pluralibacter gergoviae]KMK22466.1 cellulose biosynthesis protein BcsE [Pluralibacter gergoviae]
MTPVFSFGIQSLWSEVSHMPAGGVWWVNVERRQDAVRLLNQTVAMQEEHARVAVITMSENPHHIVKIDQDQGPQKIDLFSMPNEQDSLYFLRRDLLCSLNPTNYLFIILIADSIWENIPLTRLKHWLNKNQRWASDYQCSLLILNYGTGTDTRQSALFNQHQSLSGLARLHYQGDNHLFDITFWRNEQGVSAHQQLTIINMDDRWLISENEIADVQPRSDEQQVLCTAIALEGAPLLSEYWSVFDSNSELFNAARSAQAATLLFSVETIAQIEPLAREIHTLRRQRGNALKIVVREVIACLRTPDERLLLGCGANLIIPWNAPLSRGLTLIESVQRQLFQRHVPDDLRPLLEMTHPLALRGFQKWDDFCDGVLSVLDHPLLTPDTRGVMVALRPVPGLRAEQALTLCRPSRTGDIVTIGNNTLILFLVFCRINDIEIALNHIFPLPIGDIFTHRKVWYEDRQLRSELIEMQANSAKDWTPPLPPTVKKSAVINATHDGRGWRRTPKPRRLLDAEGSSGK